MESHRASQLVGLGNSCFFIKRTCASYVLMASLLCSFCLERDAMPSYDQGGASVKTETSTLWLMKQMVKSHRCCQCCSQVKCLLHNLFSKRTTFKET